MRITTKQYGTPRVEVKISDDVAKINRAIINRWSRSALEYIKNGVWKLREGQSVK